MIYKGEELSNYPICDTDIWVDVILAKLDDELIVINSRLKELNNLKNQYEKLEQNTDSFFINTKGQGEK